MIVAVINTAIYQWSHRTQADVRNQASKQCVLFICYVYNICFGAQASKTFVLTETGGDPRLKYSLDFNPLCTEQFCGNINE